MTDHIDKALNDLINFMNSTRAQFDDEPALLPSILIASLIRQVGSLFICDSEYADELYTKLCDALHKHNFIDNSHTLAEFDDTRKEIRKSIYALLCAAHVTHDYNKETLSIAPKDSRLNQEFEISEKIGIGGSAIIYKAKQRSNGQECVIKQVPETSLMASTEMDQNLEVIQFLINCPHTNIVRYKDAWVENIDDEHFKLVTSQINEELGITESQLNSDEDNSPTESCSYLIESSDDNDRHQTHPNDQNSNDNVEHKLTKNYNVNRFGNTIKTAVGRIVSSDNKTDGYKSNKRSFRNDSSSSSSDEKSSKPSRNSFTSKPRNKKNDNNSEKILQSNSNGNSPTKSQQCNPIGSSDDSDEHQVPSNDHNSNDDLGDELMENDDGCKVIASGTIIFVSMYGSNSDSDEDKSHGTSCRDEASCSNDGKSIAPSSTNDKGTSPPITDDEYSSPPAADDDGSDSTTLTNKSDDSDAVGISFKNDAPGINNGESTAPSSTNDRGTLAPFTDKASYSPYSTEDDGSDGSNSTTITNKSDDSDSKGISFKNDTPSCNNEEPTAPPSTNDRGTSVPSTNEGSSSSSSADEGGPSPPYTDNNDDSDSDGVSFRNDSPPGGNNEGCVAPAIDDGEHSEDDGKDKTHRALYIQMPLCELTLDEWIAKQTELVSEITFMSILTQILAGLHHIHSNGIVHHDMKPSNIFVTDSNSPQVQLADFGFACIPTIVHNPNSGTLLYMAPEQQNGICTNKSDIYSVGILLIKNVNPTATEMELANIVKNFKEGIIPELFTNNYPELTTIIQKCVIINHDVRPSAKDLLNEIIEYINLKITQLEQENQNEEIDVNNSEQNNLKLLELRQLQDEIYKLKIDN
ncbi:hypothetical protein PV327_005743 [Microctonus hyperodae]|uniref:non-specific serine/threonine protein kinase n=1 Tax=Microctonus hyperodae TaxID=165561 RepID=A0AA39G2T3_MICHY|nr:hypothetical protein PV327_005743 [Microctonus hyperodae]